MVNDDKLKDLGSIPGKELFSMSHKPEWLWNPPRSLYQEVKLVNHIHVVPSLRVHEQYFHALTQIHGMVLN
jgi:hypothetical protein